MTNAEQYRSNADNCAELARAAKTEPERNRFTRMKTAWQALAEEQDWLDGQQTTKPAR